MKDLEGKIHLVSSLPLFRSLSRKEKIWVAESVHIVESEREEILFTAGDGDRSLFLILSGGIKLFLPKKGEGKREEEVQYLKKGEYFGIQSLLTGEKHSHTAVTVTESRFLVLSQAGFQKLIQKIPYLSITFSKMLTKSLRGELLGGREYFRNSVVCLVHSDPIAKDRLASELVSSIEEESGKKSVILHFAQNGQTENPYVKSYKFKDSDRIKETLGKHYASHSFIFLEVFPDTEEDLKQLLIEESDHIENYLSPDKKINLCDSITSESKENEILYHETNIRDVLDHGKWEIHIRRKARELSGVQIGVALGGGAALGLAQVGIMKVMEEEGIIPDMIAGTSIGAVIGAFWASGLGYKGILPLLGEIDSIFKMFKLVDLSFPGQGLLHGKHVRSLLEKYLGDLYFEDLPIKLRLISCDISTRQEIVLSEGKVLDAVMASISIPGVFVPQPQENGKTYVDGGIVNPLPVSALTHEGVQKIIAINSMPSSKDEMKTNKLLNLNVLDIIVNSLYSLQYRIGKYSAQEADVYLNPILPNSNWFEFWRSSEFIQLGETVAKSSLQELKQLFSEKN
ncbi:cyclic nucleotide-binding and patatin-like phospholipase domain-containing protein [Leptospira terpstrae]|uniref:Phospholipase, patatin family n=1 Tax=Leptospira terpstrae serovar Hualin str. LT 11-33 = ATCC 700639 TaxID=1257025 RepID=N1VMP9_9LEPT|nr:cyclic nucleotide-binding and patatin-like phospholipase domain-containing protein [Leptospira terpstrae]EMY60969.1 phospholipase, patatin family [Leptospira terpstrae serovar Hualin str. LT 11-33 = ATCC 700639]